MNNTSEISSSAPAELQLAFDVGHSSIGWAVLQALSGQSPTLLGCGSVIFPADDCLASQRRGFRRQRRHIRSTRQRISRIALLLEQLLKKSEPQLASTLAIYRDLKRHHELTGTGHAAPWFLAARVLCGGALLNWSELWDVLRWYAHNRGYDGNKAWSSHNLEPEDAAAEQEDTEKVEKARGLLGDFAGKHGRPGSMAEVWCDISGIDPLGTKISCNLPGSKRPKAQNAAFPRETVEEEVTRILRAHLSQLPGLDEKFIAALMRDWRVIPVPDLRLPLRYQGGLLFGQLVPRFENRIIARCPITFEHIYQRTLAETGDATQAKNTADKLSKVPSADCVEFFCYRWTMQLANVQIATADSKMPRRLTAAERQALDAEMRERGAFTKGDFKKAVRSLTGTTTDNLEQMLVHPDADKALIADPAQKLIASSDLAPYFAILPDHIQKRVRGQLRQGKRLTLGSIRAYLEDPKAFDSVLSQQIESANTKRSKKGVHLTREILLQTDFRIPPVSGRAPHSRQVMQAVIDFNLATDRHPAEGSEGAPDNGPLFRSQAIRRAQLQRAIDEQTNNHLVRHRLRLLDRLHLDILKTFADEDTARIGRITIEVNRDLRELSGKTNKQIAQDFGQRLSNFRGVTEKLEKQLAGTPHRITPGLIRKARIAEDLGWTCPYTGKPYDVYDLIHRRVDKDHIIPRADRASDSLDSLVITFSEVNRMKGKRTAAKFVEDCQTLVVEGASHLSIKPLTTFLKDADSLETFRGHDDDKRRKKNRKRLLALRDYVEKEFVPADLTQTSQLVRLGAQALEKTYTDALRKPVITSLPGSVTGSVRKSWHLLPLLAAANSQVMDPVTGEVRTKTEIRDITHLHHALDACTIAFASHFLPRDGGIWELLLKRHLTAPEQETLLAVRHGLFARGNDGRVSLLDLPETYKSQIRKSLAECRVVQHIPADMSGLLCDETVYRVFDPTDLHPSAQKLAKWFARQKIPVPAFEAKTILITCRKRRGGVGPESGKLLHETKTWRWVWQMIPKSAVLGLQPKNEAPGKLKTLKAVKILGDNFGLAILDMVTDPAEKIVLLRHHKVWNQLVSLRQRNEGQLPSILRIGVLVMVPNKTGRANYRGNWMVRGLQLNQKSGFLLDISGPDQIKYRGQPRCFQQVSLTTLLRDGLQIMNASLTGVKTHPVVS